MIKAMFYIALGMLMCSCTSVDVVSVPTITSIFKSPYVDVLCTYEQLGERILMSCIDINGDAFIVFKGGKA